MSTKKKRQQVKRRKPSAPPRFAVGDQVRLSSTDQDDRIRAIFGLTSDDPLPESSYENVHKYHAYLAMHLAFPFEAAYREETGPFESSHKHPVTVVGLADWDCYEPEEVGLLFKVRHDREQANVVQARVKSRSGLFGFLSNVLGLSAPQERETSNFMLLADLELTRKDANRQLLTDFDYWMWNY